MCIRDGSRRDARQLDSFTWMGIDVSGSMKNFLIHLYSICNQKEDFHLQCSSRRRWALLTVIDRIDQPLTRWEDDIWDEEHRQLETRSAGHVEQTERKNEKKICEWRSKRRRSINICTESDPIGCIHVHVQCTIALSYYRFVRVRLLSLLSFQNAHLSRSRRCKTREEKRREEEKRRRRRREKRNKTQALSNPLSN